MCSSAEVLPLDLICNSDFDNPARFVRFDNPAKFVRLPCLEVMSPNIGL